MSRKAIVILSILLALLPLSAAIRVSAADPIPLGVKISEIKLGGGSDPKEFVELFNTSSTEIDLTGLQLDYAKTTFSSSFCQTTNWKSHASPSSAVTTKLLSGNIPAHGFAVFEMSLTDNTSGSLRLSTTSEANFVQHDLVGWGTASACYQVDAAATPPAGQVIKRTFDDDGNMRLSADLNNSEDFTIEPTPSPGNDVCLITDCSEPPIEESSPTIYKDAYITELLPDPASPQVDSEDEFIELYNPHDEPLSLSGYTLHTASRSSSYKVTLQDITLQPGEYKALYSSFTNLSLVNGEGYAWLVAPDGTVVFETEWYPDAIASDQAWALVDASWQLTDILTPGAANQILLLGEESATDSEACPEGKYRSAETGRCQNNVIAAAIQPCKSNQERNAETNRCRNIVQASQPAACKPGQVRNQETNRCRNVTSTSSTACAQGYERNAETNRCRKVTAVKAASTHDDQPQNKINFIIITVASIILVGYATYEYRQDIVNYYLRLKQRFQRTKEEVIQ